MPQYATAAATVSAPTTTSTSTAGANTWEDLQPVVLTILSEHGEPMKATELIEIIHERESVDPEAVRRAMLSLSADGRTAYTSDWHVFLTGRD